MRTPRMSKRDFLTLLRTRFGDGTGEGSGDGEGGKGGEGGDGKGGEKTFTQKDVDAIVTKRLAKEKEERQKLVKDLKAAQDMANMTKEEKEALALRIDEAEKSLLTKDEQAAREKANLEKKFQNDLKKATEDATRWQQMYHTSTIQRSLSDAATANDAESAEQIIRMFGSDAYLSEDRGEDGKSLGTFTPKLKFKGLGEDKKPVDMDLPVADAIKKIRDDGRFPNLFKHGGTPGTGSKADGKGGGGSSGEPTLAMFGGDQAKYSQAYQTWRRGHNLDGSKRESK